MMYEIDLSLSFQQSLSSPNKYTDRVNLSKLNRPQQFTQIQNHLPETPD